MLLVDDKFVQAESEALAVNAAGSDALQDIRIDVLRAIGFNYVKDKKSRHCVDNMRINHVAA